MAVATGSRIPHDYPTPDQLSEFDRFGEFASFKTSQVFGKNRSEESIHHGKEDDSANWWVTMVPILNYWVALATAGPARESEKHQPQWSHRGDPDRGDRETDLRHPKALRISLQIPIGITEKHPTIF